MTDTDHTNQKADPDKGQETDPGLENAYRDSIEEGRVRLSRNVAGLIATGLASCRWSAPTIVRTAVGWSRE